MKQSSSFSGLAASPAGESFGFTPTGPSRTTADFLRQNANILADAHFQRETHRQQTDLVALCAQRDTVLDTLDAYTQHWLATAAPDEGTDAEMENYQVILDVLQRAIQSAQATLDLCHWTARQYTHRLLMDLDRYAELEHLRSEVQRLIVSSELSDAALINVGKTAFAL